MYKIICVSSGIIVATFNDRAYAKQWLEDNNTLNDEYCELFRMVRADKLSKSIVL